MIKARTTVALCGIGSKVPNIPIGTEFVIDVISDEYATVAYGIDVGFVFTNEYEVISTSE